MCSQPHHAVILKKRFRALAMGLAWTVALWVSNVAALSPCSERLAIDWRFHTSAPLTVAPAVGPHAETALASLDGYVHALGQGGRFLWSYTLDSRPSPGLDIDQQGRVYAVSTQGEVHVLEASGSYSWGSRLPSPMVPTGAAAHSARGVLYVPSDLNLYAFSSTAGLLWRAFLGSSVVLGPVVDPQQQAWVLTRAGDVHRIRTPSKRSKFSLNMEDGTRAEELLSVSDSFLMVLTSTGLRAYSTAGKLLWRRDGITVSTPDARVVQLGTQWHWLSLSTGQTEAHYVLDVEASALPQQASGWVYIPTQTGRLYALSSAGDIQWCDISTAPLLQPVVQPGSGLVIVASGDGSVAAVRLRAGAP